jgi:glycosyltransferase involved in cell wall biosynthesis
MTITGKNILMYGPLSPPMHGQSVSFTLITQRYLCSQKYIVNTNYTGMSVLGRIMLTGNVIFKCIYFFLTKKIDLVFFSCSRSSGGAIKDICLINMASFFKIRMINHIHGADFDNLTRNKPRFFARLIESAYNKVQTTIVLTEGMKAPFLRFKSMKIKVLPNFYDPVLDNLDNQAHTKYSEPFEILYFSNVIKTKGIIELIDAIRLLTPKKLNIRLNIAGGFIGDEECSAEEIKSLFYCKIAGATDIVYHGVLNGQAKSELLYKNNVFVLPSYYVSEAFPLSIIEAMRAGCAIITTRFNYLDEIVKPENGILVGIRNAGAIADALECLINDRPRLKNMQEYNMAEAKSKYSLATNLELLQQIFEEH